MLKLISNNIIEGVVPPSDCEKNLNVKWLTGTPTGSFYIGDKDAEKRNIESFITGKHECKVDSKSFFKYLDDIDEIVRKFKHIFIGPINVLAYNRHYFEALPEEDRKISISYDYPDRYLKTSKLDPNVREFKLSLAANITNVKFEKKEDGSYVVYVNLVENWRELIMARTSKCDLNSMIEIFNSFIEDGINDGKAKIDAARLFGIKYAELLKNNGISLDDLVYGSNYNEADVLDALKNGALLSKDVIWESKGSNEDENKDDIDEYSQFKKLIEWFTNQSDVNNGLKPGRTTSGQGYKGASIRKCYEQWRNYRDFVLDCTMQCGYNSASSGANYIHVTGTGINIRPSFLESKEIAEYYFEFYKKESYSKENVDEINAKYSKKYVVTTLGLFDGLEPNEQLKEMFDDYKDFVKDIITQLDDSYSNGEIPNRSERTDKKHSLNSILYGAPGTGKTYATAAYALAIINGKDITEYDLIDRKTLMEEYKKLVEEGKIVFTTFHQNYSYEDFIQGLRPTTNEGQIKFIPVDGVFKKIADKAMRDNDSSYVIIIDEINRANISKVLGELITLIEDDKRWGEVNELSVTLPSGDDFAVPNNLYIVGTMNTADKSISIIDVALRRRFDFIEQEVDPSKVSDVKLKKVLNTINDELKKDLDSTDLLIGHAYFMNKTEADLKDLMNRNVIPLLYEYYFDNSKKVLSLVKAAIADTDLVIDDQAQGRVKVKKGA